MDVLGPLYRLALSYMPAFIELRLRACGARVVGDAGPFEKLAAVADLGAVRRPASKCDRLVRGVGTPLSIMSEGDLIASNESGLMF